MKLKLLLKPMLIFHMHLFKNKNRVNMKNRVRKKNELRVTTTIKTKIATSTKSHVNKTLINIK